MKIKMPNGWRTIKSLVHKIRLHGRRGKGMAESFSREKIKASTAESGWMENPVLPSCVTPAGTSIEVQNEWEEKHTHTVHIFCTWYFLRAHVNKTYRGRMLTAHRADVHLPPITFYVIACVHAYRSLYAPKAFPASPLFTPRAHVHCAECSRTPPFCSFAPSPAPTTFTLCEHVYRA